MDEVRRSLEECLEILKDESLSPQDKIEVINDCILLVQSEEFID